MVARNRLIGSIVRAAVAVCVLLVATSCQPRARFTVKNLTSEQLDITAGADATMRNALGSTSVPPGETVGIRAIKPGSGASCFDLPVFARTGSGRLVDQLTRICGNGKGRYLWVIRTK